MQPLVATKGGAGFMSCEGLFQYPAQKNFGFENRCPGRSGLISDFPQFQPKTCVRVAQVQAIVDLATYAKTKWEYMRAVRDIPVLFLEDAIL